MKTNICRRCGAIDRLMESHHKKFKSKGGSDAAPNRILYCNECHDYIHARENITTAIVAEERRLEVLRKRLEILDKLNTPDLIKVGGYQSYFKELSGSLPQIRHPVNKCVWGIP